METYERHFEGKVSLPVSVERAFAYLDDHRRLSSHMNGSSWMMGGGRMETSFDRGGGRELGSHIRISGKAFGLPVSLDEVVVRRDPPTRKAWETVGEVRLLVIGPYRMAFELMPQGPRSELRVSIDYHLPVRGRWLGILLGDRYARWCVDRMLDDARKNLETSSLVEP